MPCNKKHSIADENGIEMQIIYKQFQAGIQIALKLCSKIWVVMILMFCDCF